MIYELSTVCIRDQKKLKQSEKVGSTMHKAAADMLLSPPAFSQRKKFRLLPIGQMLLNFLLVFLMLECLSLCNVIWWFSWQRHDNSDDVMKMLCLFATQTEVWSRRMTCGWSNWAVAPPTQMIWLNYWQWWWWWWWHISYLSRAPRVYSCKFFWLV